jgi:putative membrane protein
MALKLGEIAAEWSVICILASALVLSVGVVLIRLGHREWHMRAMLTASGLAVLFLVLYLTKLALGAGRHYVGPPSPLRTGYFAILLVHTILATLNVFLAGVVLYNALKGRSLARGLTRTREGPARPYFARHRAWARWTAPVWIIVALSGWLVFLILIHHGALDTGVHLLHRALVAAGGRQ